MIDAFVKIVRADGVSGLWRGFGPNLARNCVVNATELVAYDQAKQVLLASGRFSDNAGTHILSGFCAGFCATMLGSPVDVLKTRVMNQKPNASGQLPYRGALDCAVQTLRHEGPLAFYKGFVPNFARSGSWNVCAWLSLEQLKKLYLAHVAE